MSGQSTPARATPPKRLTLTPGPRPLHLGNGSFSQSSPSPLATPPTTAPLPRRVGSVSYQTRDDFQLGERPQSAGLTRGGSLREFGGRRKGHGASASVANTRLDGEGTLERAQQEALERKRRSASALDDQPPPVLTLAEKHKDLLHFIAQKESKCVELRAQLVAHEADLLQLKKKWEKIVAKGNDRQARPASGSGAVDLVRGIFGLGELAMPSSTAPTPPTPSSSSSTPGYTSSPIMSSSPHKNARPNLTTTASRAASKGHLAHTPHSSSSSNSTGISSANTTRLSLSSASSLGGAELFKEKEAVEGDDDDPDAWGPFETAHTDEPESISGSALGLSGIESTVQAPPNAVTKSRGTETFAKSTKRASTILSDMSGAWSTTLNALAPSPAPSLTKPTGATALPRSSPSIRLTSSKPVAPSPKSTRSTPTRSFTTPKPSPSSKPFKPSPTPISTSNRSVSVSLLDDDDGAADGLGAVLQPSPSASVKTKPSDAASIKTTSDAFGEDWNW